MFAYILAAATTTTAPRYLAMMLMVPGVYTGYVVSLVSSIDIYYGQPVLPPFVLNAYKSQAWISNSLPRPPAKRAAALAFINAISNTSSIYASYMYPKSAGK